MDSNTLDLSPPHQSALTTLVNEYSESDSPVKSARIAEKVNRTEGSVKNQMRKLSALGLVDSVPGPRGGYQPTEKAFQALERDQDADGEKVVVAQNYERVDVTVDEITLTNVHHPTDCRARVHFQDILEEIDIGDALAVGPTPEFDLVVVGEVLEILGTGDEVILEIGKMEAPFVDDAL